MKSNSESRVMFEDRFLMRIDGNFSYGKDAVLSILPVLKKNLERFVGIHFKNDFMPNDLPSSTFIAYNICDISGYSLIKDSIEIEFNDKDGTPQVLKERTENVISMHTTIPTSAEVFTKFLGEHKVILTT